MQHMLRMGIDVGSTTVKVVLLDEQDNYLYKKYIRHYANILDTVHTLLQEAQVGYEDAPVHISVTGSGGMAMAEKVRVPFVQEVIAETRAIKALYPQTDVIIELGGEDAKVTYLGQTAEHRMNGSCAGGYGCFHRSDGDIIANGCIRSQPVGDECRYGLSDCGALRCFRQDRRAGVAEPRRIS